MSLAAATASAPPPVTVTRVGSGDPGSTLAARARRERLVAVLAPICLLAIWEAAARIGLVDERFFPRPSAVLVVLYDMIVAPVGQASLLTHVGHSLSRVAVGFVIGAIPAISIGLLMGLFPLVRAALQPIVGAIFPIPKVALLPLIMLIFGLGEESKWAIIAIGVFFPTLINTAAGVRNIETIYLDVGRNFNASRLNVFRTVALPGALPMILAGLRVSWGVSLLVLVAAEMLGAKSGIGFLIYSAWQVFEIEQMYVGIITIATLGILSFAAFDALERRLLPWKAKR